MYRGELWRRWRGGQFECDGEDKLRPFRLQRISPFFFYRFRVFRRVRPKQKEYVGFIDRAVEPGLPLFSPSQVHGIHRKFNACNLKYLSASEYFGSILICIAEECFTISTHLRQRTTRRGGGIFSTGDFDLE